jgi:secreted PhoX family phosphatase
MTTTRRSLFRAAALGALGAATPRSLRAVERRNAAHVPFVPLKPSTADVLAVPDGYRSEVLLRWGDDIGNGAFGSDPDFTAFFPIDLLDRGFDPRRGHASYAPRTASSSDGLLVVNHEFLDRRFVHGPSWRARSAAQLTLERTLVGVSVSHVTRKNGKWTLQKDRARNRRYDANTPFRMTGPAAVVDGGPLVTGTLANCSGGVTPWGTVLSCEENFQDFLEGTNALGWDPAIYGKRHYGWVVEIDPFDPAAVPRKHTAMGRFRHENVGIRVAADGTVVAYMGDDKRDSCVFKFVASRKLSDPRDRSANLTILESGQLYAADFGNGRWIPIPATVEALADARQAALDAGATPVDRPEDLEVDPIDGSVLIALTNNSLHGNYYGHIVRLAEAAGDPSSTTFSWNIFATGGPQSGFCCPDNLLFDDAGNLWVTSDVSDVSVTRGIYSFLGNNALFYFPRSEAGGGLYRFVNGPVECELTGPSWTPDGSTMFLAVQHPGGHSGHFETTGPASHWPDGGSAIPRGAVVAITGFR